MTSFVVVVVGLGEGRGFVGFFFFVLFCFVVVLLAFCLFVCLFWSFFVVVVVVVVVGWKICNVNVLQCYDVIITIMYV